MDITTIRKGTPRRVYIREWRKHLKLKAKAMAERLEIARESWYRLEREPHTLSVGELAEVAAAFGVDPERLWRLPPPAPSSVSLDAIVDTVQPEAAREKIRTTSENMIRDLILIVKAS